jgi:predicted enzyme related to lactoylglutathione lyase
MEIKSIKWLGVETEQFQQTCDFYRNIFKLKLVEESDHSCTFQTKDGAKIEIFDQDKNPRPHFKTGPVAGFEVDDIEMAKVKMETSGIEFFGEINSYNGSKWIHFRGPDNNIYELLSN